MHSSTASPQPTAPTRRGSLLRRPWSRALLIYAAFAAVCCFLNLGGYHLLSMEPMVVEGGSAMLESGSWASPHLYGELHTFKPALAYWISAAAQWVFDRPNELLLRLPFALLGLLLGLALLLLIGRRLGPRAGLLVGMATVGTPLFLERVRIAEFDVPLAAGAGLAVGVAVVNLTGRNDRATLWLLGYLGLAAGFLAKGVPALMAYAPGLLAAALWTGTLRRLLGWRHLAGATFAALLIGGYLGWAYLEAGAAIFDLPAWEASRRGFEWSAAHLGRSALKPALVFVALLPWSGALLLIGRARRHADAVHLQVLRAGLGFLLCGLLAFVAVPTHEMRYYLPLAPALAIVAGVVVDLLLSMPARRPWLLALRGLFALTAVAVVAAAIVYERSHLSAVLAATLLLAFLAFRRPNEGSHSLPTLLAAVSLLMAVGQAWVVVEGRARSRDLAAVAERFREQLPAEATLWVVGPADPAGKHGSLYHHLENRVRTFCGPHPPRQAEYLLLVDDERLGLSPTLAVEELARMRRRGFSFQLARRTGAGLTAAFGDGEPPRAPGATEGSAALGRQSRRRTPSDSARCTLVDYQRLFER